MARFVDVFLREIIELVGDDEEECTYLSFFLSFFFFLVSVSGVSSSNLVFFTSVLSTAEDVARLRAVEGGGDACDWRRSPLRVVDFEARVEGIASLLGVGDYRWWW